MTDPSAAPGEAPVVPTECLSPSTEANTAPEAHDVVSEALGELTAGRLRARDTSVSVVELIHHAEEIRALLADPGLSAEQRRTLLALEAEVAGLRGHVVVEAQRAERFAQARATRAARAERVRVHPSTHPGPCPEPGAMWVSRAQVEEAGSGHIHLDVDERCPSWWPRGAPRSDASPALMVDAAER